MQERQPDGTFVRQWGTTGQRGQGFDGGFNDPTDVAVSADGVWFVADGFNDRVQVFGRDGTFGRKRGGPFAINIRGDHVGWFRIPTRVALGPDARTVFVADQENDRVQKFTRPGAFRPAFGACRTTGAATPRALCEFQGQLPQLGPVPA